MRGAPEDVVLPVGLVVDSSPHTTDFAMAHTRHVNPELCVVEYVGRSNGVLYIDTRITLVPAAQHRA